MHEPWQFMWTFDKCMCNVFCIYMFCSFSKYTYHFFWSSCRQAKAPILWNEKEERKIHIREKKIHFHWHVKLKVNENQNITRYKAYHWRKAKRSKIFYLVSATRLRYCSHRILCAWLMEGSFRYNNNRTAVLMKNSIAGIAIDLRKNWCMWQRDLYDPLTTGRIWF